MIHSLAGLIKICFSIDNLERIPPGWNGAHWESLEPVRGPKPHVHPQPPREKQKRNFSLAWSEMGGCTQG